MDDLNLGLLLLILVLACPISMMWMMRGRHRMHRGMHGTEGGGVRRPATPAARPAEHQAQQDAVEREIAATSGERPSPSNRRR